MVARVLAATLSMELDEQLSNGRNGEVCTPELDPKPSIEQPPVAHPSALARQSVASGPPAAAETSLVVIEVLESVLRPESTEPGAAVHEEALGTSDGPTAEVRPVTAAAETRLSDIDESDRLLRQRWTTDLLQARAGIAEYGSDRLDLAETRSLLKRTTTTLHEVLDNDRLWKDLADRADLAATLKPSQELRLRLAGDLDWDHMLKHLGYEGSSSLDILELTRDVAIGIDRLFTDKATVDVHNTRNSLRRLVEQLDDASAGALERTDRGSQIVRMVVFVATRVCFLIGLAGLGVGALGELVPEAKQFAGPEAAQAFGALIAGVVLHGLERVLDRTLDGPAKVDPQKECAERLDLAVQALSSAGFDRLMSTWRDAAASATMPTPESISSTLVILNKATANAYLAYESSMVSASPSYAMHQQCDGLIATLRTIRQRILSSQDEPAEIVEALHMLDRYTTNHARVGPGPESMRIDESSTVVRPLRFHHRIPSNDRQRFSK